MKTNSTQTPTFIKVSNDLLRSNKFNSTQKLFISYVLGWQANKLTCFESNQSLADAFALKVSGIRELIKGLNKFDFFTVEIKNPTNMGKWASQHEIRIDENKLMKYLKEEIKTNISDSKAISTPKEEVVETKKIIQPEAPKAIITNKIELDMKRSDLIEEYNLEQKYAKCKQLQLGTFKRLTNNYFDDLPLTLLFKKMDSTGTVEGFMSVVDELIEIKKEGVSNEI